MFRYLLHTCLLLVSSAVAASEVEQVRKITDADFERKVSKSHIPIVVHFYAEWCGPCRMIAPSLEDLASKMAGHVSIVKVDIDESPITRDTYELQTVPTLAIFKDGKIVARQVGAAPQVKLEQWIRAVNSISGVKPSH